MIRVACLIALLATPALAQDATLEVVPGNDTGVVLETSRDDDSRTVLETQPARHSTADGAILRMVDRVTGALTDLSMANGDSRTAGRLQITMGECRFPIANPASDAFAFVEIAQEGEELFAGWMIASSPALSALDHPRYDVWVLRCIRAEADGNDG